MIDVTVPNNTVFTFFSMYEEANFEVIQIKLLNNLTSIDMSILKKYISENKIYCYGHDQNGSLVVKDSGLTFVLKDFIQQVKGQKYNIEYI